ncbi:MAG TPA: PfkB family carbohydrate kinase [Chloroflexia bacterium]|nr:PfkB family carbohydrate kinase [Chloroflexia bacterium]
MTLPEYLVVGHISKDLLAGGGTAPGGTVLYAGLTAQRLGVPAGLVTALAGADRDLLAPAEQAGAGCAVLPSDATTTFALEYTGEERQLRLHARAAPVPPDAVPVAWRGAAILHLGPIAAELDARLAWDSVCPGALLGVTPQGWMRAWDAEGLVRPTPWRDAGPILARADVLVMSVEDVAHDAEVLHGYVGQARLAVVTAGHEGATIYEAGHVVAHVPACRAHPVDFTGAGDVFTAAFLIGYRETGDAPRAAAFAHAAAAFAIEAPGTTGIADRDRVDARAADPAGRYV